METTIDVGASRGGQARPKGKASASQKDLNRVRIVLLLKNIGFAALTYGAMVLYATGYLPLWGLIAANVLFYIRAYLRMHDLCHAFSTNNLLVRFVPTALYANPVWGGVAPFITTHVQHHQYLGTNQDPWLPYYAGHPLRALFFNMIEPEVNLYNYVRQRGWNRQLRENLAFDIARHGANFFFFHYAYLTHVVIQRICHGLGVFLFNFWPHRETWTASAPLGSWNREKEIRPYAWLAKMFFGTALTEAAMYHNRHHVLGQIREPSHRYVMLTDEGTYTRFNYDWPLRDVQFLAKGPRGNFS
jgi:fatty acid desaturase